MSKSFDEIANDFTSLRTRNYLRIWEPFMRKYKCNYVCELGVRTGEHFHNLIAHQPKLAVAVDAWIDDGVSSHNDLDYSQDELNNQYEDFQAQICNLPFVKTIRDYTVHTAKNFPDNYFDFVYIDADHTYQGTMDDLKAWYPKLKKGKFLTGDDYNRTVYPTQVKYDVKRAVNDFANKNNLEVYEIPGNEWATAWAIIKPKLQLSLSENRSQPRLLLVN